MKIVEKELSLNDAQDLLNNLAEENIDATISISIETKDSMHFEKSDQKFKQITMDDIDAEDIDDTGEIGEETDAESGENND